MKLGYIYIYSVPERNYTMIGSPSSGSNLPKYHIHTTIGNIRIHISVSNKIYLPSLTSIVAKEISKVHTIQLSQRVQWLLTNDDAQTMHCSV